MEENLTKGCIEHCWHEGKKTRKCCECGIYQVLKYTRKDIPVPGHGKYFTTSIYEKEWEDFKK